LVLRSRCAVRPRVGRAVFRGRVAPITVKRPLRPLVEFRVPSEFSWRNLASSPQRASTSHGLSVPSAHTGIGDPLAASLATARYGPPSGFGYPLGGFRPPNPRQPCFMPTALLGFALRSSRLSKGIRCVSARKNPHTVSPTDIPTAARRKAGPVGRGFWASALLRDSCGQRGFSAIACRRLPWVFPLQGFAGGDLRRAFARHPLTRFATTDQP
jgi:hypothetical protein